MQGQFWKNFLGCARARIRGPRCPGTARTGPRAAAWPPPAHPRPILAQSARPVGGTPRNRAIYYVRAPAPAEARHETRPSTTFGRHRPTTPPMAKRKPQVDGLRFSRNERRGRGVGSKSSRCPAFVAEAF